MKTYPRYFTHKKGFGDDTLYLRVDKLGGFATLVTNDKKETNEINPITGKVEIFWWTEKQCEENCNHEFLPWKEITREEAEKL